MAEVAKVNRGAIRGAQSAETAQAIYLSHWYNIADVASRRRFLFLLQCSQYELSFKPFGLFKLSLETFVKVGCGGALGHTYVCVCGL